MGPIISRLFTCSNEEIKNKNKKQRVLALVLSLWVVEELKSDTHTHTHTHTLGNQFTEFIQASKSFIVLFPG